ncbi:MAG: HEPN domain-containing protein [Desulfobacterales bacterium]|nr:HEPN domain-containing protein [Desulfobacterales bacterium]
MKNETRKWLNYAAENLKAAYIAFDGNLYNVCLQNIQQSVEKNLKVLILEKANVEEYDELPREEYRTHNTRRLLNFIDKIGIIIDISIDDCRMIDQIYIPSKYPTGSAWPDYEPDQTLCYQCLDIAKRVDMSVNQIIS